MNTLELKCKRKHHQILFVNVYRSDSRLKFSMCLLNHSQHSFLLWYFRVLVAIDAHSQKKRYKIQSILNLYWLHCHPGCRSEETSPMDIDIVFSVLILICCFPSSDSITHVQRTYDSLDETAQRTTYTPIMRIRTNYEHKKFAIGPKQLYKYKWRQQRKRITHLKRIRIRRSRENGRKYAYRQSDGLNSFGCSLAIGWLNRVQLRKIESNNIFFN